MILFFLVGGGQKQKKEKAQQEAEVRQEFATADADGDFYLTHAEMVKMILADDEV